MRALAFAALTLVAGGGAAAFLAPVPTLNLVSRLEGVSATTGLSYGDGPRDGVDVYRPAAGEGGRPVVVFFYGGAWEEGERSNYRFVGAALASRGIVAIIPDYRLYPEVRFPDFLKDAARAVRWARDHAAKFGGDPGRLVLAGHSAGAHIAAMLAFDPQWLAAEGIDARRDIAGFAGLAGPYDFLPLRSPTLMTIFGPEPDRPASQPIRFVTGAEAPAFLAVGLGDVTVDPGNTLRMAARIEAAGGSATLRAYDRVTHRSLLGAFAWPLRFVAPVLDEMSAFVAALPSRESRS